MRRSIGHRPTSDNGAERSADMSRSRWAIAAAFRCRGTRCRLCALPHRQRRAHPAWPSKKYEADAWRGGAGRCAHVSPQPQRRRTPRTLASPWPAVEHADPAGKASYFWHAFRVIGTVGRVLRGGIVVPALNGPPRCGDRQGLFTNPALHRRQRAALAGAVAACMGQSQE